MLKINFQKDVLGILLLAFASVFLFTAYNLFFVFPSYARLLDESMENETARIATKLEDSLIWMSVPFEEGRISNAAKNEAALLKGNFGLWKIRLFSPKGVIVYDDTDPAEEGRTLKAAFFNDVVAKGHTYETFVPKNGRTPFGDVAPADLAVVYVPVMEDGNFIGACEVYRDVSAVRKKAGSLWLRSFLTLSFLVTGLLAAVVVISVKANRNAGARQKAESALHQSEYFLRTVIDTEPECVKLMDRNNTVLMMNAAGLRMVQASSPEEVKGQPFSRFVDPEYRAAFEEMTRRVFAGGSGSIEFKITGLKGRTVWMETNAVPFLDEKGGITGLLGITRDVTSKKLRTEALERSLREKEILLRELYHRTKNNMQVISSLISLQSASVADDRILRIFDDTKNRILAMAMVHEKLYQSKDLSSVNMNEYMRDLAHVLLESQTGGQVTLKLDTGNITLPIDTAIPCGLIINELISNSIKYAFKGGRKGEIMISMHGLEKGQAAEESGHGRTIRMVYADDGPGLKDTDLEDVKTLGLKLVKNLVTKQLAGRIELASGKGAKFRITFTA